MPMRDERERPPRFRAHQRILELERAGRVLQARVEQLTQERDDARDRVAGYERYDVWQGMDAENRRLTAEVGKLREELRAVEEIVNGPLRHEISIEARRRIVAALAEKEQGA